MSMIRDRSAWRHTPPTQPDMRVRIRRFNAEEQARASGVSETPDPVNAATVSSSRSGRRASRRDASSLAAGSVGGMVADATGFEDHMVPDQIRRYAERLLEQ